MKAELVCLLVLLTAVVQGNVLRTPELKQYQVPQLDLEGLTQQIQQLKTAFGDFADGNYDVDGASIIYAIDKLLDILSNYIEQLEEQVELGQEELVELGYAIESLTYEIQTLEKAMLSFQKKNRLRETAFDLLDALSDFVARTFKQSVLDIYDASQVKTAEFKVASLFNAEDTVGSASNSTAPSEQVRKLITDVRRINGIFSAIEKETVEVTALLEAMTTALNGIGGTVVKPDEQQELRTIEGGSQQVLRRQIFDRLIQKALRKKTV